MYIIKMNTKDYRKVKYSKQIHNRLRTIAINSYPFLQCSRVKIKLRHRRLFSYHVNFFLVVRVRKV